MNRQRYFLLGCGLWLLGMATIIGGYPQIAWLPISWASYAFGYWEALLSNEQRAREPE